MNPNPKYVVDGHQFPNPESALMGDGEYPPFRILDTKAQLYFPASFHRREEAECMVRALLAVSLEDLLERWTVHEPGMWENDQGPQGWWAVSNDDEAIIAYFAKPADAYRWRMEQINRELNP